MIWLLYYVVAGLVVYAIESLIHSDPGRRDFLFSWGFPLWVALWPVMIVIEVVAPA